MWLFNRRTFPAFVRLSWAYARPRHRIVRWCLLPCLLFAYVARGLGFAWYVQWMPLAGALVFAYWISAWQVWRDLRRARLRVDPDSLGAAGTILYGEPRELRVRFSLVLQRVVPRRREAAIFGKSVAGVIEVLLQTIGRFDITEDQEGDKRRRRTIVLTPLTVEILSRREPGRSYRISDATAWPPQDFQPPSVPTTITVFGADGRWVARMSIRRIAP